MLNDTSSSTLSRSDTSSLDYSDIKWISMEVPEKLKNRFTLLQLRWQCQSNYDLVSPNVDTFEWVILNREFNKLINYYDNGGKLNEDVLVELRDVKIVKNIISMRRVIKLIKIF